ncbi:MAG: type II toxin-antitoxin system VapC family toxin [Symbiobacteriia bacterium]
MARLKDRLAGAKRIGIDTNCLKYLREGAPNPRAQEEAEFLFRSVETGLLTGVVSTVSLHEVLVGPLRRGRPDLANAYRALLRNFPNLSLVSVSDQVADFGAELRARDLSQGRNLKTPDALCLATAIMAGCNAFVTNDMRLGGLEEIRILPLAE